MVNYKPEGQWNTTEDDMGGQFHRKLTSDVPRFQCVGSGSLEKRKVDDVRFTSALTLERRAFISHS